MRTAIAVTLIICGTLLVALPPLSDFMLSQTEAHMLKRAETYSATLAGRMSANYRFGCFVLGGLMVATSVVASTVGRQADNTLRNDAASAVA